MSKLSVILVDKIRASAPNCSLKVLYQLQFVHLVGYFVFVVLNNNFNLVNVDARFPLLAIIHAKQLLGVTLDSLAPRSAYGNICRDIHTSARTLTVCSVRSSSFVTGFLRMVLPPTDLVHDATSRLPRQQCRSYLCYGFYPGSTHHKPSVFLLKT